MKILLTGGNGILGKEISKNISNCIAPSRNELDVTNRKAVFDFIKINKFDLVIHTAALTSIRECENNKKNAWKINVKKLKDYQFAEKVNDISNIKSFFKRLRSHCCRLKQK